MYESFKGRAGSVIFKINEGGEKAKVGLTVLQREPLQYFLAEGKGLAFVLDSGLVLAVHSSRNGAALKQPSCKSRCGSGELFPRTRSSTEVLL